MNGMSGAGAIPEHRFINMNSKNLLHLRHVSAPNLSCMVHLPSVQSPSQTLNIFYKYGGCNAPGERSFETKACDESRSGVGSGRVDFFTGGRRIRSGGADNGPAADAELFTGSRDHSR